MLEQKQNPRYSRIPIADLDKASIAALKARLRSMLLAGVLYLAQYSGSVRESSIPAAPGGLLFVGWLNRT